VSAFSCPECGKDIPLSNPCPRCEAAEIDKAAVVERLAEANRKNQQLLAELADERFHKNYIIELGVDFRKRSQAELASAQEECKRLREQFHAANRRRQDETERRHRARAELSQVQAQLQRFILGASHGPKCWMDDNGWHCGDGCRNPTAIQCTAAVELARLQEQFRIEQRARDNAESRAERFQEEIERLKQDLAEERRIKESHAKALEWVGPDLQKARDDRKVAEAEVEHLKRTNASLSSQVTSWRTAYKAASDDRRRLEKELSDLSAHASLEHTEWMRQRAEQHEAYDRLKHETQRLRIENGEFQGSIEKAQDEIHALRGGPWHPIESAPKDGTDILGFCPNMFGDWVRVLRWDHLPRVNDTCWVLSGVGAASIVYEPSKWMPVPK
jgi:chromosome segregation ATPase